MKYILGRKKKKKGFTLMELLVSLGIVAALSMMVAPMIMGKIDEAKEKADISNANAIAVAVKSEMISRNIESNDYTGETLTSLIGKYFDGKIPEVQSIKDGVFTLSVSNNKITVTVGTAQFYPVDESTLPSYVAAEGEEEE